MREQLIYPIIEEAISERGAKNRLKVTVFDSEKGKQNGCNKILLRRNKGIKVLVTMENN